MSYVTSSPAARRSTQEAHTGGKWLAGGGALSSAASGRACSCVRVCSLQWRAWTVRGECNDVAIDDASSATAHANKLCRLNAVHIVCCARERPALLQPERAQHTGCDASDIDASLHRAV